MKKFVCLAIGIIYTTLVASAQCNEYYQFSNGNEWEFEMYNGKGKLNGKNHQKVTSFEKTGTGFNATINSTFYSDKGKETMTGDLSFKCEAGILYIDMRNFISDEQLKALGSNELQVEGENLEIPPSLSVGQSLKDGSITVTAVGATLPMSIHVNITDRKVVGKETITTPAGTFECFKITANISTETQMGIKMNMNMSSIDWMTTKVGTVKNESYNKNGKLMGYSILSSWK